MMSIQTKTGTSVFLPLACWLLLFSPLLAQSAPQGNTTQAQTGTTHTNPNQQGVQTQPHTGAIMTSPVQQGSQTPPHSGVIYSNPNQQGQTARMNTGTTYMNSNQQLINQLQNILTQQAQFGHYPSNNQLLNGIQNLVRQHSHPGQPPRLPVVNISNQGPGNLLIQRPNQPTVELVPHSSMDVMAGNSVSIEAVNQNTNILLSHRQNGIAKFWDADDKKYTFIRPNQQQSYNLGRGIHGYRLESN